MYFQLKTKTRMTTLSKMLTRAHLEVMYGSPQQASAYCKKEGDYVEHGALPLTNGQAVKRKWEDIRTAAKEGRLDDIDPKIYIAHYHTLKRIRQDHMVMPADADGVTGVWYYGPPGTGKSRTARENYPGAFLKSCNKWWDGYQAQDHVIIDDLDKAHTALHHYLKIWSDRYAFPAEHKGGTVAIRPKTIVVTSNYTPEELWPDQPVDVEAIRRRFKFTHFSKI